jgi:hypothetical protein
MLDPHGHPFWWLLTGAVLLWYSTITFHVAWKGIADIRRMLRRLGKPALALLLLGAGGRSLAAEAVYTLERSGLKASVTVRDGRLSEDRLETDSPSGPVVLATDGGFSVEVVWSGWRAPGKANNADNFCRFGPDDFRFADGEKRSAEGGGDELLLYFGGPEGLRLRVAYALDPKGPYLRRKLALSDDKGRNHLLHALWTVDAAIAVPATVLKEGGFGQPVALGLERGGAFVAVEWPASENMFAAHGGEKRLRAGEVVGETIPKEGIAGASAVYGLTPDASVKLHFMRYVETIRAGKLRPYTLYNSWYDLRSAEYPKVKPSQVMNEENVTRIVRLLRTNMVEKHGIALDACVLDDGWDVYRSDWLLRPAQFPNGIGPIVEELKRTKTRLGIWFGPTGGYSFRKERVGWMREAGYETAGDQMWVGGPKYGALLEKRVTDFTKAGAGYFKWDGFQFVASAPGLGTPPGLYARRAVLARVASMARAVRGIDPDVFLNVTSGTWLSPWWLLFADQIWMDGEDYGSADVPSISTRDSSITYRDLVLHQDFREKKLWFPVANLMTHGVLKGTIDIGEIGKGEPLSKFADEVVFYLARGVTMYELYISPDVLSEGEWRVLADSLKWARANFGVLSKGEMIGGDPFRKEPYGYAHFDGARGIVAVRNPDILPKEIGLALEPALGLDPAAGGLVLQRIYPTRWVSPRLWKAGETASVLLSGYEAAVYEIAPLSGAKEPLLAGVVFEERKVSDRSRVLSVLETTPDAKVLNPASLDSLTVNGRKADPAALKVASVPIGAARGVTERAAGLTAELAVAPAARSATLALLVKPAEGFAGKGDPEVTLLLDGAKVAAERVAKKGAWAWYSVPAAPGGHTLSVDVAPGKGEKRWSGSAELWLTGAVAVTPVEVTLAGKGAAPAARPLPPTGRGPNEVPRSVKLAAGNVTASPP